jgi:hypothetical protein
MVYLAFEVGGQPDGDVRRSTLHLEVKFGSRVVAALAKLRVSAVRNKTVIWRRTTFTLTGAVSLPTNMLMR